MHQTLPCVQKIVNGLILITVLEFSYGKMYAVIRLYNKMWGKAKYNIYLVNTKIINCFLQQ